MKNSAKRIKPYGRLIQVLIGFWYDFSRIFFFSAWRGNMQDNEQRNYNSVMIYHALEKSMCFSDHRIDPGWSNALSLLSNIKEAQISKQYGFFDKTAIDVLSKFVELNGANANAEHIRKELLNIGLDATATYNTKEHGIEDFRKGVLDQPENFFFSRYSLRDFKQESISEEVIKRVVSLAIKTPSACNRQAWHVYYTNDHDVIKTALKYQSGNKGFGENIPNLLVITSDLKAFVSANERNQHWIDGGMFAMSMVYALHALGIASCCLNWSQSPKRDKLCRKFIEIRPNHTIIMMIALGWPNEQNKVCESARRGIDEIYSDLLCKSKN